MQKLHQSATWKESGTNVLGIKEVSIAAQERILFEAGPFCKEIAVAPIFQTLLRYWVSMVYFPLSRLMFELARCFVLD